jgi:hypothetical protein
MVEMSLLVFFAVLYSKFRLHVIRPSISPLGSGERVSSPIPLSGVVNMRERSARVSTSHGVSGNLGAGTKADQRRSGSEDEGPSGVGSIGCIWGTEERDYR